MNEGTRILLLPHSYNMTESQNSKESLLSIFSGEKKILKLVFQTYRTSYRQVTQCGPRDETASIGIIVTEGESSHTQLCTP